MSMSTAEVAEAVGVPVEDLTTPLLRFAEYGWVRTVDGTDRPWVPRRWADWTPRMVRVALEVSDRQGSPAGKRHRRSVLRQVAVLVAADPTIEWFFVQNDRVTAIADPALIPQIWQRSSLATVLHIPRDQEAG